VSLSKGGVEETAGKKIEKKNLFWPKKIFFGGVILPRPSFQSLSEGSS
jgi:hypothetical protein